MFICREVRLNDLYRVALSAVRTTSAVMFLVAAAFVSAWLVTIANIPQHMVFFKGLLPIRPKEIA